MRQVEAIPSSYFDPAFNTCAGYRPSAGTSAIHVQARHPVPRRAGHHEDRSGAAGDLDIAAACRLQGGEATPQQLAKLDGGCGLMTRTRARPSRAMAAGPRDGCWLKMDETANLGRPQAGWIGPRFSSLGNGRHKLGWRERFYKNDAVRNAHRSPVLGLITGRINHGNVRSISLACRATSPSCQLTLPRFTSVTNARN